MMPRAYTEAVAKARECAWQARVVRQCGADARTGFILARRYARDAAEIRRLWIRAALVVCLMLAVGCRPPKIGGGGNSNCQPPAAGYGPGVPEVP